MVNPREGKTILRTGFIEVDEVDAHAPLFVGLSHNYYIGQPCQKFFLSDKPCLEEQLDFVLDGRLFFWGMVPHFLVHGFLLWVQVQLVSNHVQTYAWHVKGRPREGVFICLHECNQLVLELLGK